MNTFSFSDFCKRFPTDASCLEEIKKARYPKGVICATCNLRTRHYKITGRTAYSCELCRTQVYPLADTIFEKTTTPLRVWFYAIYLMVQANGDLSAKQLQRELEVTYKTAWRMHKAIALLIEQNNLAKQPNKERKWTFFNKFQITLVEKKHSAETLNPKP
jgi:hypothetical protein